MMEPFVKSDARVRSPQREKIQKTLIDIAHVSKRLHTAIAQSSITTLQMVSTRTQLDKIVTASRAILAKSLETDTLLDPGLEDWLSSKEPDMCLCVLGDMEKLVPTNLEVGGTWWGRVNSTARSMYGEASTHQAIKLFNDRRDFFHLLLSPETWNCWIAIQAQPKMAPPVYSMANPSYLAFSSINIVQNLLVQPARADKSTNKVSISDHQAKKVGFKFARGGKDTGKISRNANQSIPEGQKNIDQKLDSLLEWLRGVDCSAKYEDVLTLRQPGTCAWLPAISQYKAWRNNRDSFLWLEGKPGAGKTVLTTSVIETTKKALKGDEIIVFFYCDFRSERTANAASVMCSILSQLLRKLRDAAGKDLTQLVDDLIKEKTEGTSIVKRTNRIGSLVSHTARQFDRQPFVFIDALDECQDLENLLHALRKLKEEGGTRLFLSSRPLQIIKDSFLGLPSISMDQMRKEVSADIRLHVAREVEGDRRLRILEEGLKLEISDALHHGADGMFRWIQCQIDTLKKCATTRDVRKALESLPSDLEETYERILRLIDPLSSEGKVAMRALVWLVAALRSLYLTEVLEALSIDLGARRLDRRIAPVHGPALLDTLGSLVVYREDNDTIALSHFTVKEYLVGSLTQTNLPMHHIDLHAAHEQVSRLCMVYISALIRHPTLSPSNFGKAPGTNGGTLSYSHEPLPLLDYVFLRGFDHLKHLKSMTSLVLGDIVTLRLDMQQNPAEWAWLSELGRPHSSSPLRPTSKHDFVTYTLISLLPEPCLRAFLYHAPFTAFDGTSPLVYAAYLDKIEHARTLLAFGIDIRRAGLDVLSSRKILPIEVALHHRHRPLFDLFLVQWNAPVPSRLFSAIFGAGIWSYDPYMVVKLLHHDEFAEWVAKGRDQKSLLAIFDRDRFWTLLVEEELLLAVLRRLVQVGCKLSAPDSLLSVLRVASCAASRRYLAVLQYLCSQNAPMSSRIFANQENGGGLIKELASLGVDVELVLIDGNTVLEQVFGKCKRASSCCAPDCRLCSTFLRFTRFKRCFPMDLLIMGRTGAGKSTFVNMITGIPENLPGAARVSNDSTRCTLQPTSYAALVRDPQFQIWDMPGVDRTLVDKQLKSTVRDWFLHLSSSYGKLAPSVVQTIWCMHASDMDDPVAWQQFRDVYMECHSGRMLLPLLVLNHISPESHGEWETACRERLRTLDLPAGPPPLVMRVRGHQDSSSAEYESDSSSLRSYIRYHARHPEAVDDESYRCSWVISGNTVCRYSGSGWDSLKKHIHEAHDITSSGGEVVTCFWINCGDQVKEKVLAGHIQEVHLEWKDACPICFRLFASPKMVANHLQEHFLVSPPTDERKVL